MHVNKAQLHAFVPMERVSLEQKSVKRQLQVHGMTCSSCVALIERELISLNGIVNINISLLSERADIEFQEDLLSLKAVIERIEELGFEAEEWKNLKRTRLTVNGMTCTACVATIENSLRQYDGILSVDVCLSLESCVVEYDEEVVGLRNIIEFINDMGFDATLQSQIIESKESSSRFWSWSLLISLLLGIPNLLISMVFSEIPQFSWLHHQVILGLSVQDIIELSLSTPMQFGIGWRYYKKSYLSLRQKSATMDVLVCLGTSIAYFYSIFSIIHSMASLGAVTSDTFLETSSTLIMFITVGKYLESKAKKQTSTSLAKLMALRPTKCRIVEMKEGKIMKEKEIPVELLQKGDFVKVLPGENISVDGVVYFGASQVDESMITGESKSISKTVGSLVISGTCNLNGILIVHADKIGSETALFKIVEMVENAQMQKAPIQNYADRISAVFVPFILILGFMTFITWLFIFYVLRSDIFEDKLIAAVKFSISVIVVACPCAVGLATPTAIMVGTGVAAENGILIKDTSAIEIAPHINVAVFDKTGTITTGLSRVAQFMLTEPFMAHKRSLMGVIGAIENYSEHPIAKSIVSYAKAELERSDFRDFSVENIEHVTGRGLKAIVSCSSDSFVQNSLVCIGNLCFIKDNSHSNADMELMMKEKDICESKGMTCIFLSFEGNLCGMISLQDQIREEAISVVQCLKDKGIRVLMASGDTNKTASIIASRVGIDEVFSEMTPIAKRDLICTLQSTSSKVMMIGDGINDSPALAQSDISISVFTSTDVAMETSSIVLMKNDLMDVFYALNICDKISKRIKWNFTWAFIYNIVSIPIAAGTLSYFGIMLHPMFAGLSMALSSLSVVLSSLTLKTFTKRHPAAQAQKESEGEEEEEDVFLTPLSRSFSTQSRLNSFEMSKLSFDKSAVIRAKQQSLWMQFKRLFKKRNKSMYGKIQDPLFNI